MRLTDLISETFHSLTSNKVRSGLTILGIVVGIASVIAMLGIGAGAQKNIEDSVQAAGSNVLTIMPSSPGEGRGFRGDASSVQSLTTEDAAALAKLPLLSGVAPNAQANGQLVTKNANANASLIGATPAYQSVKGLSVKWGSFISDRNDTTSAQVVVLGSTLAEDLFGVGVDPTGQRIRSGSMLLTVVGVLEAKGTSGFTNVDSSAIIPLATLQRYVTGSTYLSTITITVTDEAQMTAAQNSVSALLLSRHGIADPANADFGIMNMADLLSSISTVTGTFTALLAAIAGISLLVGGIGIMNMMLTTVTERTREIGLRKAIGADDNIISLQFLAESVVLTLLGGLIGIVLGWVIAVIASNLLSMTAVVSVNSIGLAAGVCAVIGVVFGYYPARRAAAMSPIDALRYQ